MLKELTISRKSMDWSNPKTTQNIRYSRYIASWIKVASFYESDKNMFKKWLMTQDLTNDEVIDILQMYDCGKVELEHDICKFLAHST